MKRVPVEGVPAERPRCPYCNRRLRPVSNDTQEKQDLPGGVWRLVVTRRAWAGRWLAYAGLFCRLNCALNFAVAAHEAGYRVAR